MNSTRWERMPVAHSLIRDRKIFAALVRRVERRLLPVHRIGPDPILHFVLAGAWFAPVNADRIHVEVCTEINDDPLWMQRVVFMSELFGQVRIALPEGIGIAIG